MESQSTEQKSVITIDRILLIALLIISLFQFSALRKEVKEASANAADAYFAAQQAYSEAQDASNYASDAYDAASSAEYYASEAADNSEYCGY